MTLDTRLQTFLPHYPFKERGNFRSIPEHMFSEWMLGDNSLKGNGQTSHGCLTLNGQ
jgi:hypothetical protein